MEKNWKHFVIIADIQYNSKAILVSLNNVTENGDLEVKKVENHYPSTRTIVQKVENDLLTVNSRSLLILQNISNHPCAPVCIYIYKLCKISENLRKEIK